MKIDPPRHRMDKIEFWLDEEEPTMTGWYINSYDRMGDPPFDSVGPYETKTEALRIWHAYPNNPKSEEPSDAG